MKKNAKKNNKGFSLVELIIVVAIMAILIGVLGGQYLKFVERSRQSADKSNVDEIVRAVQIYAADPEASPALTADSTGTVLTLSKGSVMTIDSGTNANAITKALQDAGLVPDTFADNDIKLKSENWGASVTITITVDSAGNVTATASPATIME